MLPQEILAVIGEPGKNAVLILDELFAQKEKEYLRVVYDSDILDYCAKKNAPFSGRTALTETQTLAWYGVVKITKQGTKLLIKKDKFFNPLVEYIKNGN